MLEKIKPEELVGVGVIGLPDTPRLPTEEMQRKFEETAREVIIPKFNALVDELSAEDAAGKVSAVSINPQELTEEQKAQARKNVGVAGNAEINVLLDEFEEAKAIAQSVRDDADAGMFNGKDGHIGKDGAPGKDGESITVKDVSESTADGGSNVVLFSDGNTLTVKNGNKGSDGAAGKDGKTPVKGTDYWTVADQEETVQQVIAALGTPVFGRVDADKNIILTGELADGIYTLKYEDAAGNKIVVGTVVVGDLAYFSKGKIDSSTGAIDNTNGTYAYSNAIEISSGVNYVLKHDALACSIKIAMWDASGNFLSCSDDVYNQIVGNEQAGSISLNQYFVSNAAKFRIRIYVYEYDNIDQFIENCNSGAMTVAKG